MSRRILSSIFITVFAPMALVVSSASGQNSIRNASLSDAGADDRVLTFGPTSLSLRGPDDGQIVMRASELDLIVSMSVKREALSQWVTKADVMLVAVGNKAEPLPALRGAQGSMNLRALTAWGTPRYELRFADRDRKKQVVAELTLEEANRLLLMLRSMAPPPVIPMPTAVVDRPVAPRMGNRAPHYPQALRNLGVNGQVVVRIMVDTTGRVAKNSFEVVRSSDERLVRAVREAVMTWRFVPAEASGKRVSQLIELPFVFSANGDQ
ncbi:MAG TPA: energy transducer TonB [Gemmatimonadaceae bacterium]|nr:energy transducer TonB [Gemmatimonadaceae bacterium]